MGINLISKKKLIVIFLTILVIIVGWICLIDVPSEREVSIVVTNRGFWDKNNIHLDYGNKSNQEEITQENRSFLFIEIDKHVDDHEIIGFLQPIGFLESGSHYTTNNLNRTITAYGLHKNFNYSTINNTLKVVCGNKIDISGYPSGRGGILSGYYSLPCSLPNTSLEDENEITVETVTVEIDENYNVFVNGKLLNINESVSVSRTFMYISSSSGGRICGIILVIPIVTVVLLWLKLSKAKNHI